MTPSQRQLAIHVVELWAKWTLTPAETIYGQLCDRLRAVYTIEPRLADERLLDIDDPLGFLPQLLVVIAEQIDDLSMYQQLQPLLQLPRANN